MSLCAVLLPLLAALAVPTPPPASVSLPAAIANDNRSPAGTLRDGVLTLRIVVQWAAWTLNSKSARDLPMLAFAEEGRAPTIPGPVLRLPAGSRVRVSIRNPLPDLTLVVRGLTGRGVNVRDSLLIVPGATVEREFVADAEGTFYYWGSISAATAPPERFGYDSQLNGAFVVDTPAPAPPLADRIFLISLWSDSLRADGSFSRAREFWAINGRSWPETERLQYTLGDSIQWRLINASADQHPMHLHGFYYRVDSRGTAGHDTVYSTADRRMAVTEKLTPGTTMKMTWSPDRAGGWIFHCHLTFHLGIPPAIAGQAEPEQEHDPNRHTEQGMAGLLLGIDVRSAPDVRAAGSVVARRQLRLVIHSDSLPADTAGRRFAAILDDRGTALPRDSMRAPGSPILLRRGEPTTIMVVNQSGEPTSIHWHGIELESFYDGVVGLGGTAAMRTKAIMPSDSFPVRITAPRAGSFMYHTHLDDVRQQNGGLYGSLVVLEPGAVFDEEHDLRFMVANDQAGEVLLNGTTTPTPLTWHMGQTYRLRLANITTGNAGLVMRLLRDGQLSQWRIVAKDGFDLPSARVTARSATQPVSNGEIYDVEVTSDRLGEMVFEVRGGAALRLSMPVHVVP